MATAKSVYDTLSRITSLNGTKNEAVYDIARLLAQLRDTDMHEVLGYESFVEMARSELPFSAHMARRYVSLHDLLMTHTYTRTQALALLAEHAPRDIIEALNGAGRKMTAREVSDYVGTLSDGGQIGIHELSKSETREVNTLLARYGMSVSKGGRRVGLRTAFMTLIEEHDALLKQLDKKSTKKAA